MEYTVNEISRQFKETDVILRLGTSVYDHNFYITGLCVFLMTYLDTVKESAMKVIEIYMQDLNIEKQQEIIEALGGDNGNYDVFPIATIELEGEDENN